MMNLIQIPSTPSQKFIKTFPGNSLPQARLTILQGEQKGEVIFLKSRINVFGRLGSIRLRDELASRRHMQIYNDGSQFILEDLNSSNGTLVNGRRVFCSTKLNPGDSIQVGNTKLYFDLTPQ